MYDYKEMYIQFSKILLIIYDINFKIRVLLFLLINSNKY